MVAVRAVLYCCAVLSCAAAAVRVGCVHASTEVTKNVLVLPESAPESYQQIKKIVRGQKRAQVLI